jgi:hypothetical protein
MNRVFDYSELVPLASTLPRVSTRLSWTDYLGAMRVRMGIRRDAYRIDPGLYAVGHPTSASDVFVTANYKLSFDTLRKNLEGMDGWILVLDTKGINVWCAAGKKTFGTAELVRQIGLTSLPQIVSHKKLILPQLSAAGVSAHQVREIGGFSVIYGPVRASDIKPFVASGYKATKEMRRVHFGLADRAKLIPNDFFYGKYYLLAAIVVVLILSGINKSGLSFQSMVEKGPGMMLNVLYAYISGIVLTPMMLPWIPGRPFALKGFFTGFAISLLLLAFQRLGNSYYEISSWFLIITGISSFLAMNFTGSSTYTSLSGVKKEMRVAIPLQIAFAVTGLVLMTIGRIKDLPDGSQV